MQGGKHVMILVTTGRCAPVGANCHPSLTWFNGCCVIQSFTPSSERIENDFSHVRSSWLVLVPLQQWRQSAASCVSISSAADANTMRIVGIMDRWWLWLQARGACTVCNVVSSSALNFPSIGVAPMPICICVQLPTSMTWFLQFQWH